ncbi:MAG: alpha-amylase, partial [Myxococcales bacterium]|nr:alpha-amylase [Myxococcales bacterium]
FSKANPQKLYLPVITDPEYHYEATNVQAQQSNSSSLLWWTKRLIALRKENEVLGTGTVEFLFPENNKILAFIRSDGKRRVLVVINLSRFAQGVELDLSPFVGQTPVEMFGRTPFPTIGERPYFLSIGPHSFYWFTLEEPAGVADGRRELVRLESNGPWTRVLAGRSRTALAAALLEYAVGRRWYRGKARSRKGARIADVVPLDGRTGSQLVLLEVDYVEGDPELYVVPLAFAQGEEASRLEREHALAVVARLVCKDGHGAVQAEGLLVDGLAADTPARLMEAIRKRHAVEGEAGQLMTSTARAFKEVAGPDPLVPRPSEFEQTNSSVLIGDKMLLKIYRQIEAGTNPELELGAFLTERGHPGTPRMLAAVEYRRPNDKEPATLATVQELVPNEGVAWQSVLAAIDRYFERVLQDRPAMPAPTPTGTILQQAATELPPPMPELLGGFVARARLLGKRTAELHLLLGSEPDLPAFAPQPFTGFYQQSLFQGAHKMWVRTVELLKKKLPSLPPAVQDVVRAVCADEARVDARLRAITAHKLELSRIRIHGDLHLGQILDTGGDFVIIDFEGEPGRPLNERRYKRCPLVDVAGMMRSFHYASESALRSGRLRHEDAVALVPWARAWTRWMRAAYLHEYLKTLGASPFVPVNPKEQELLLAFYQLEKCVYEIRYELNNRPEWLEIPLSGLRELMEGE